MSGALAWRVNSLLIKGMIFGSGRWEIAWEDIFNPRFSPFLLWVCVCILSFQLFCHHTSKVLQAHQLLGSSLSFINKHCLTQLEWIEQKTALYFYNPMRCKVSCSSSC